MATYKVIPNDYQNKQIELGAYAFNIDVTQQERNNMMTTINHSISLGAFYDDTLSAQVLITPFTIHFHDKLYKMGGIGFVSSYPEYRGSGDVSSLMKLALQKMNDEEMALSYLAPFSYPFYRKYGFEQIFDQFKWTIPVAQLPRIQTKVGTIERLSWNDAKETLKALYEERNANRVGSLQREDWWWEHKFSKKIEQKVAIYQNEDSQPEGYLVYTLKGDTFFINEFIYTTHTAYEMIWGFIASHSGSFNYFEYLGSMEEQQAYLLANPRVKQEVIPYMMGRIVNIERFMTNYPFNPIRDAVLYLDVKDEVAPWNDGIWELSFLDGQQQFKKVSKEKEIQPNQLIKGDIQAWTQVLVGYRSAKELYFFNRLDKSEEAVQLLQEILPAGTPVLSDYF